MTETLTTLPSPSGPLQIPTNSTATPSPEKAVDPSGEIRCICDYTDDDGYTICCDECETWQHYICMGLPKDNAPSKYKCSRCAPRAVDAKKAREMQRMRRLEDEERNDRLHKSTTTTTTATKRKRATGVSHKKKDSHAGGTLPSSRSGSNAEKTGHGKLSSPRESQAPTSRKRNARGANGHHSSAAGSPGYFPNGDDDDTDADKYKFEFTDISNQSDRYSCEEVKSLLLKAADPANSAYAKFVKHLALSEFSTPKASVRSIPDHSKAFSVYPPFGFVLDAPCAKGKPIALFKGEVGMQDAYMNHPPNQYAVLHHPKTYVIFYPELQVCIDARNWGTEARFVRRSCRPNCSINAIALDGSKDPKVVFALYATESIKAGTEVTIGWDWNSTPLSRQLASHDFDFSKISPEDLFQVAMWVNNLLENTSCACNGGGECLLAKIKKHGGIPSPSPKIPVTNGRGKKAKGLSPPISKEPTPSLHDEMDIDSRADSVAKRKSRSRDLTPHDTAVESTPMTSREERKFKDMLSRIEKQNQEDQQPQGAKRRKRTSTVSVGTGPTNGNLKVEKPRGSKSSRGGSPLVIEVADASTGRRRTSGSSTGSDTHRKSGKSARSPSMSVVSSAKASTTRKVVAQVKATYTDASMQTEADDDIPWWRSPEKRLSIKPCEPRMPLRKRLMQLMLANREAPLLVVEQVVEKKRKHEEVTAVEESATSPPKIVKVTESVSKRTETSETTVSPAITVSQPPSAESAANGSASKSGSSAAPPATTPAVAPKAEEKPQSTPAPNDTRPAGLHLKLPPPGLPNGASSSATSPSSTTTTPVFSPSTVSSLGGTAQPSPTRMKKLSLGDYSKRKHKVAEAASEKKDDDHSKPTTESTLNTLSFLTDQRKLVDIVTPPGGAVPPSKPNAWSVR